jgi:hypothetical protein
VLRRILIVAIAMELGACALMPRKATPAAAPAASVAVAPQPADGLWAILDPGCAKPQATDFHAWPSCASPFWINGGKAVVLTATNPARGRRLHSVPYAADYSLTPGEPLIAQVGTEKDGYLYLALTNLAEDDQGRLIGAVGAAVACPRPTGPNLAIRPNLNGCDLQSLATVRKAANATLRDRSILSEVAWIAPGSPMSAP